MQCGREERDDGSSDSDKLLFKRQHNATRLSRRISHAIFPLYSTMSIIRGDCTHKSKRNFYNTTKLGPRPTKGAEVGRSIAFSFFPCTLLPARFNRGEDWSDSGLAIVCIVVGAGGAMPCLRRKQVRRSEKFHKFFLLGRRVGNFEKKSKGVGE